MILGSFLRGVWLFFCYISENGEIVKNSTACRRELNFHGLAESIFVYLMLVFGVWFLDGFGDGFLMILGWIWGAFWTPKSTNHVMYFGIDF